MNVLTVIFSFNTPARTHRCYNELSLNNPSWNKLVVLDNSDSHDKVCWTPDTVWISHGNIGHGGMIDHVLNDMVGDSEKFDYVGMLNNDTYGYHPRFMERLLPIFQLPDLGLVSPAILPGGSCWPCMTYDPENPTLYRKSNFVETIAPWYSSDVVGMLQSLQPMEWFGHIDRAISIQACKAGLRNVVVDDLPITHEAGKGRDELGTREDYCNRWRDTVSAWYAANPAIADLVDVWPDEINTRNWAG